MFLLQTSVVDFRALTVEHVSWITTQNIELAYARLLTNPEATYKNYSRNIYATYGMAKDNNIRNLSKR